jgi:hypothetical protein
MTYACPARELAADIPLLKLQRLQNIGNFPSTPVRDLRTAFSLPYTVTEQNYAGDKQ